MTKSWVFLVAAQIFLSGCAYRFGFGERSLPGGYNEVAVPVFSNSTMEVGIETYFTNALIRQIERSGMARTTSKELAPATLLGTIDKIEYQITGTKNLESENRPNLPKNSVAPTGYNIILTVSLALVKNSNGQVLWRSRFTDERVYTAPKIYLEHLNTAFSLYNQSARHQTIALMADDMMQEAYERMTENF